MSTKEVRPTFYYKNADGTKEMITREELTTRVAKHRLEQIEALKVIFPVLRQESELRAQLAEETA